MSAFELVAELPPWQTWFGEWNFNATLGEGRQGATCQHVSETLCNDASQPTQTSGVGCLVAEQQVFACVWSSDWEEHKSPHDESMIVYPIKKKTKKKQESLYGSSFVSSIDGGSPLVALAGKIHCNILFKDGRWIFTVFGNFMINSLTGQITILVKLIIYISNVIFYWKKHPGIIYFTYLTCLHTHWRCGSYSSHRGLLICDRSQSFSAVS